TRKNPLAHTTLLTGLTLLAHPIQIVIAGSGAPDGGDLLQAALASAPPGATVQTVGEDETLPSGHPAHGKRPVDGKPTAYVCEGQTCRLPVTTAEALVASL
ncbi:MAG: thioredoxin domain-containing protein, partial [Geminicoccaceae bacterium]